MTLAEALGERGLFCGSRFQKTMSLHVGSVAPTPADYFMEKHLARKKEAEPRCQSAVVHTHPNT